MWQEGKSKRKKKNLQFPEVIAGFMVATNENGGNGGHRFTGVVLVKGVHVAVLWRAGQALKIRLVADRLKVTTADEEINHYPHLLREQVEASVDGVELSMAAALDSNFHGLGLTEGEAESEEK